MVTLVGPDQQAILTGVAQHRLRREAPLISLYRLDHASVNRSHCHNGHSAKRLCNYLLCNHEPDRDSECVPSYLRSNGGYYLGQAS